MKKLIILLVLASLSIPALTLALCSADPDEIAIFFSEDCDECINCLTAPLFSFQTAYVVLLNASVSTGVSGFEFMIVHADGTPTDQPLANAGAAIVSYQLPETAINTMDAPAFQVGLVSPLPWSPCITLLSFEILTLSANPWCVGVKPLEDLFRATIPGEMIYAAGASMESIVPMRRVTGPDAVDFALACYNVGVCEAPVAADATTWSGVKSLYR